VRIRATLPICVAIVVLSASQATAGTPDVFQTVTQPVGVAATQTEVLVSQPFCVSDNQTGPLSPAQWQIVKFDNAGNQSVFAVLPSDPDYGVVNTPGILSNCLESYLAISSGEGGFPAGHIYATEGGHVYEFDANGNLVMHGESNSLVFIQSLEVPFAHTAITFDTVGTFGYRLIIAGSDSSDLGEIWTVDSNGNAAQIFTLNGPDDGPACNISLGVPCVETPEVAPLNGPAANLFPGALFLPLPGLPGDNVGALLPSLRFTAEAHVAAPETIHFVPAASPSCTFDFVPSSTSYEFLNASFSSTGNGLGGTSDGNTLYAYKSPDFTDLAGQMLITGEGSQTLVSTGAPLHFSQFDPAIYNSEGSAFVQCTTKPFFGGLSWTYWKTHTGSFKVRKDPIYNSLSASCPASGDSGAIALDGGCSNSVGKSTAAKSYGPTIVICSKRRQCGRRSADTVFAGGNTRKAPSCKGDCASLFAAELLAAELNLRKFPGFADAVFTKPGNALNGMTVGAILSQMQADFLSFVGSTGNPDLAADSALLDVINNNPSTHVLLRP
jgi:hypothetical protein